MGKIKCVCKVKVNILKINEIDLESWRIIANNVVVLSFVGFDLISLGFFFIYFYFIVDSRLTNCFCFIGIYIPCFFLIYEYSDLQTSSLAHEQIFNIGIQTSKPQLSKKKKITERQFIHLKKKNNEKFVYIKKAPKNKQCFL